MGWGYLSMAQFISTHVNKRDTNSKYLVPGQISEPQAHRTARSFVLLWLASLTTVHYGFMLSILTFFMVSPLALELNCTSPGISTVGHRVGSPTDDHHNDMPDLT